MAEKEFDKELAALRADLGRLKTDLAAIVEVLKESGREKAEAAGTEIGDLLKVLEQGLKEALVSIKERGESSVESLGRRVEQRPLLSLLIAFGAGLLFGQISNRR
jgi:ElaB/YqjD/DUF883 family membrane-anchored ribosome-binding protein